MYDSSLVYSKSFFFEELAFLLHVAIHTITSNVFSLLFAGISEHKMAVLAGFLVGPPLALLCVFITQYYVMMYVVCKTREQI